MGSTRKSVHFLKSSLSISQMREQTIRSFFFFVNTLPPRYQASRTAIHISRSKIDNFFVLFFRFVLDGFSHLSIRGRKSVIYTMNSMAHLIQSGCFFLSLSLYFLHLCYTFHFAKWDISRFKHRGCCITRGVQ